ncbi:GtrA family protein [Sphingobacterium sp. SYP-B4668]|uniref:GtrA family protein n=1 Tax=Sphingobacterium sp. SYP-B4668 TaxID=2996035 RepID=UPI0022DD72B9|nr:GtrA family protein [Sphingobacterium sp. SYP-B4668]
MKQQVKGFKNNVKKIHRIVKPVIIHIIDSIHGAFFRFIPIKTFRYAICGGGNVVLNILIYFLSYNFLLKKQIVQIHDYLAISPHIAAFIIAFLVTFPIGFYLNLFVVFQEANMKRRIHLSRYFTVTICCIVMNYILIKFFVESLDFYPTPSALLTTVIVTIFSYLVQKGFTFKTVKTENRKFKHR